MHGGEHLEESSQFILVEPFFERNGLNTGLLEVRYYLADVYARIEWFIVD